MKTAVKQATGTYLVFEGVERPVRPKIFSDRSKLDVRRYTQNPSYGVVELDDPRAITKIAYTLANAQTDRYTSLAQSQPLVRAGKISLDTMREVLGRLYNDFWHEYWFWAELMDRMPQLRDETFILPKGKNALLYRGPWKVKTDARESWSDKRYTIDVTALDPERDFVAVTVPNYSADMNYSDAMNRKWKDTCINGTFREISHTTKGYSVVGIEGLNVLDLSFWDDERVHLNSYRSTDESNPAFGSLLASRHDIEEIVERFGKLD